MANDRNAGRRKKYQFKTETITFRVPADVKELCRKAVRDIIDNKAKRFNAADNKEKPAQVIIQENKCDCYMDGAVMRRGKSKPACKMTKAQHNFKN